MPCTAKKYEISRTADMSASGFQDVDVVLTTRELIRMIKQAGVDFNNLPDEDADLNLGDYAGAGTIFGATGGVMSTAIIWSTVIALVTTWRPIWKLSVTSFWIASKTNARASVMTPDATSWSPI